MKKINKERQFGGEYNFKDGKIGERLALSTWVWSDSKIRDPRLFILVWLWHKYRSCHVLLAPIITEIGHILFNRDLHIRIWLAKCMFSILPQGLY